MIEIGKFIGESGEWWLPEKNDYKVNGVLKKQDDKYILELKEALYDIASNNRFGIVNGIVNYRKITLISIIIHISSDKSSYIFEHGFIDYHFDTLDNVKFLSVKFSVGEILNNWLASSWPSCKVKSKKVYLEHEQLDTIICNLSNSKIEVKFDFGYECKTTSTTVTYKSLSAITIKSLENIVICFEQLLNYSDWFTQFLSICCWQPVKINSIDFVLNEKESKISYFSGVINPTQTIYSPYIIMPYGAFINNLESILDNWYLNREKYFVIGYIMTKLTDPEYSVPVEIKFTQAIQALEVFHRRFYKLDNLESGRKQIITEYLEFFKSLFKHEEVDKKISSLVHNKLSHLHEATLRDRVEALIKLVPPKLISKTIISEIDYPEKISKFRNLYTHWGEKNSPPNIQDVVDYTESLRLLLIIVIFQQLNLRDDVLEKYIHKMNLFQRTLINRPQ